MQFSNGRLRPARAPWAAGWRPRPAWGTILNRRSAPSIPNMFHPVIETWLGRRFAAGTAAQIGAWPLIASGKDVLVTAPTGSGKTLAAFLAGLDRLLREAIDGTLEDRTRVLYVSPLKALSNDIRVNLEEPLGQIADLAEEMGYPRPAIRTAVRTGDTTARERREAAKPPRRRPGPRLPRP